MLGEHGAFGEPLVGGLGDAEVDDLGDGHAVVERDEDVGRLDVAVDDPLLVGVLDGAADGDEELEPLAGAEPVVVAVVVDGDSLDELHDEVGTAGLGGAGVEDAGDVRVVHQRQRLPLGLKAGDHWLGVHARLDDLESDAAVDRLGLLGDKDDTHPTFADLLQQLVAADLGAGAFCERAEELGWRSGHCRSADEAADPVMFPKQGSHLFLQLGISATGRFQEVRPLFGQ